MTISPDAMAARLAQLPRALVDVRRTSSAQSREVITKRPALVLGEVRIRTAVGYYSLSGSVPQNVEALIEDALLKVSTGHEHPMPVRESETTSDARSPVSARASDGRCETKCWPMEG